MPIQTIDTALFGQAERSGSSQAIATGVKTFTLDVDNGWTQTDYTVQIVSRADNDCWMYGVITSKTSPSITVNVFKASDVVGTFDDWDIQVIAGPFAGLPASQTLGFSSDSASVPAIGDVLNWTIETGKAFYDNSTVYVSAVNDRTDFFFATVVSYNSGTGAIKLVVNRVSGSGSNSLWAVSMIDVTQSFRTEVGNANYSIKSSDKVVALTTSITTGRTWTLPDADSVPPGYRITLMDETGSVDEATPLALSKQAGDGLQPFIFNSITTAYFVLDVISNGVDTWIIENSMVSAGVVTTPLVQFEDVATVDLDASGNVTVAGTLDVSGNATVGGNLDVTGNILGANLRDSTTFLYDNVDTSKLATFQVSGLTTATTRTFTFPDRNGVIVTETLIQQDTNQDPMGYKTGAGSDVTQATNKTTAVTINNVCGRIVTNNAALAAGATATFTVNNNKVSASDVVYAVVRGNTGHTVMVNNVAAGSFAIRLTNVTAGSLSNAVNISFVVIKAVIS